MVVIAVRITGEVLVVVVITVRITVWDQVLVVVVIAGKITVVSRIPSCWIFVMLYESHG